MMLGPTPPDHERAKRERGEMDRIKAVMVSVRSKIAMAKDSLNNCRMVETVELMNAAIRELDSHTVGRDGLDIGSQTGSKS